VGSANVIAPYAKGIGELRLDSENTNQGPATRHRARSLNALSGVVRVLFRQGKIRTSQIHKSEKGTSVMTPRTFPEGFAGL
jgi:hypothetical protein